MKRIFKYVVTKSFGFYLAVPKNAKILKVDFLFGELTIWAEVEHAENCPPYKKLEIVPTGGHVPPNGIYIGTAVSDYLVWHVYELNAH